MLHFYLSGQTFLSPGRPFSKNAVIDGMFINLSGQDLRLARFLGRKMFMTLQGCDARLAGEVTEKQVDDVRAGSTAHCIKPVWMYLMIDGVTLLIMCCRSLIGFSMKPGARARRAGNGHFLPYANVEISNLLTSLPPNLRKAKIVHAAGCGMEGVRRSFWRLVELRLAVRL